MHNQSASADSQAMNRTNIRSRLGTQEINTQYSVNDIMFYDAASDRTLSFTFLDFSPSFAPPFITLLLAAKLVGGHVPNNL